MNSKPIIQFTESGELINVEMTFSPSIFEAVRLEYYASRHFSGQDIKGSKKNYSNLVETFQIAIIGKEEIFDDENLLHTFEYYDKEHNISLGGKSRIIIVELSKADQIIDKPATEMSASEKWSVFLKYLTDKRKREKINEILREEEGIAMAGKTLVNISQSEIEFARETTKLKRELDYQSDMVTAERRGLEAGLEKGREEGHNERNIAIARNLLAKGSAPEFVQEITGLDMETIRGLSS